MRNEEQDKERTWNRIQKEPSQTIGTAQIDYDSLGLLLECKDYSTAESVIVEEHYIHTTGSLE